ncbi:MAG: GDSL-type esterase/lipase family protein [Pseudomonadota bacterium]|nr:GDSL-type esterase/lipase family protein [Pseudomonadota bacterium]
MPKREPAPSSASRGPPRKLPRLDYVLIPLVVLATTLAMITTAELSSRAFWPEHHDPTCTVHDQFITRSVPNCSVKDKIPEGPWLTYDYNACGYRTPDPCGQKPAGTLRVVFLGSSITKGYHVPLEQTFASLTSKAIAATTGLPVQDENLGQEGYPPLQVYRQISEALALNPDLVVYSVSPFDLEEKTDPAQLAARNDPTAKFDRPAVSINISLLKRISNALQVSRTSIVAQHLLYSNTEAYLRLSLSRGDKTDYLRSPLPPPWKDRFADFQVILTDLADRLRRAGVPLVIVALPSHQIGALLSSNTRPPHTDPFEFGRDVRLSAERVGAQFLDAAQAMSRVPHADRLFYLSESHLNGDGHAVVAQALIAKLQDGTIPALAARRGD